MDYNKIISLIENRRERVLNNKYNCLPFPFQSLLKCGYPGTEMGKYICVTANQKVCKSKFCDFVYVYNSLFFCMEHPEVKVKILYFCLEESAKKKWLDFQCHLLYRLNNIIISSSELMSTSAPVSEDIVNLLKSKEYLRYYKKFEEMVTFMDTTKNPTGIYKICEDYMLKQGHYNYVETIVRDPLGNEEVSKKIDPADPYMPIDPEQYNIVIVDNATNISSERGMSKMQTIETFSKYAIRLRDVFNMTVILIQHQAQAQESLENTKANRLAPTSDGLGDCKVVVRDINTLIGLYNPYKHQVMEHKHYSIPRFKDHIRFVQIIEDRDYGTAGTVFGLFFNGASTYFKELPPPQDREAVEKVYKYIEEMDKRPSLLLCIINKLSNLFNHDPITNTKK